MCWTTSLSYQTQDQEHLSCSKVRPTHETQVLFLTAFGRLLQMIFIVLAVHLDLRLISDLIIVIVSAASWAVVSSLARQPVITGYLIAGSCIGPGGMGLVIELVQVHTVFV